MVEVRTDLVQLHARRSLWSEITELVEGERKILAVLPAPGVRRVGARHEHHGTLRTGGLELFQGVLRVRRPVPVAPDDRQVDPPGSQLVFERSLEREVLLVDGALAPEAVVVLADLFEPGVRDPLSGGDVAQERDDVLGLVRSPEGEEQEGVVGADGGSGHGAHGHG